MKDFRAFTRRSFIAGSVAIATTLPTLQPVRALALASDIGGCKLFPEQETGPFYVAGELFRTDIVEGKPGVPLDLRIVVLNARTCKPLANAAVDIWHCDALGLYSGFTKQNFMGPEGPDGRNGLPPGGPPPGFDPRHPGDRPDDRTDDRPGPHDQQGPPPENHPSDKLTFLRGIQLTGSDGSVNFHTIFPGFYMGRTNHIHFKVRIGGHSAGKSYEAGHTSHTGQVFFPEEVAAKLMRHEPYSKHEIHRVTQLEDGVFGTQQGEASIAHLEPLHANDFATGSRAQLVATVDPTAIPRDAARR
jgi:protocatechuate 3,4-dioxygenase beta subunit